MAKIDLGSKPEVMSPMAEGAKPGKSEPKVHYPTMYMHADGDNGFDGVPKHEKGFHFKGHARVMSHSVRTDKDGKKSHSMELEVHHIDPEAGSEAGQTADPGESLENELTKISKKKSEPKSDKNQVKD